MRRSALKTTAVKADGVQVWIDDMKQARQQHHLESDVVITITVAAVRVWMDVINCFLCIIFE